MKSILYVGATLMIGASIYGFVDYKKNNHKKEFTRMYEMEKKESAVTVPDKEKETATKEQTAISNEIKTTDALKKEVIAAKKNSKASKKINYKFFSRAPLERKYLTKEIKIEDPKSVAEPVQKDSPDEKKE